MLKKTIEEWNEFVDEIKLVNESKQYLKWHCKNVQEPSGFGKDPVHWTNKEIVKWYKSLPI